jgi:NAD+ diphosphatase
MPRPPAAADPPSRSEPLAAVPAPAQSGYAFAHPELDRATEAREHDHVLRAAWDAPETRVIVVRRDGRVLTDRERTQLARLPVTGWSLAEASYLGQGSGSAVFCVSVDEAQGETTATINSGTFTDLRSVATLLPGGEAALAAYARALLHWQSRKVHCGRCGALTRLAAGGHRARCSDETCGQEYFPRTDPAIIVIVSDGKRCLLGRQPSWPDKRYSTIAGFVEPGETLEQAVRREVLEETGIEVSGCRYIGSQPWPFPASLMIGFEAHATSQEIRVGAELADARWFDAAEMPAQVARGELVLSPALSIAFHLIDHWYHGLTGAHLTAGPPR